MITYRISKIEVGIGNGDLKNEFRQDKVGNGNWKSVISQFGPPDITVEVQGFLSQKLSLSLSLSLSPSLA